jgi:hypothetical protein
MSAVETEANRRWRRELRAWAATLGVTDPGEARSLTGRKLWDWIQWRDVSLAVALTGHGSGASSDPMG